MNTDVTVEEPRARVVRLEPDSHFVAKLANTDSVALNWIVEVVCRVARTSDNRKDVAVEMNGMLENTCQ